MYPKKKFNKIRSIFGKISSQTSQKPSLISLHTISKLVGCLLKPVIEPSPVMTSLSHKLIDNGT